MLLIPCPWCGERLENEFTYGGDASLSVPTGDRQDDLEAWDRFVYERENPAGPLNELWHHSYGCGKWLRLTRDTRTNLFVEDKAEKP
ncbi:MAG: sarcosine oxidase subunit delta [Alphaproteobacteria bacterium]|nr:sarcosine oxidase subunit delta [Alphaproteobacteria bacterium]